MATTYNYSTCAPLGAYLDHGSLTFAGNVTGYVRIEIHNNTYLSYAYDIQPLYPLPDNPNPTTPIKVSHKHLVYEAYVPEYMDFTVFNYTVVDYFVTVSFQWAYASYYNTSSDGEGSTSSSNAGSSLPNKKLYWLGLLLAASTAFLG